MPDETQGMTEKTFTQDQLNSILADHKRTLQAENAGLKEQIGQLSTQWSEFQTMLSGMVGEEEGSEGEEEPLASGGTEDELNKRLVWLQKKHDQELAGLRGIVETEKRLRLDAEEKRSLTERDSQLADALVKNDVVSLEGGMKYFRDNLYHDDSTGKWKYRAKDGLTFDIDEGIREELPPWLKKPSSTIGGSGSASALSNAMEMKSTEVGEAQKRAAQTGSPTDIAMYQRRKRELSDIQTQHDQALKRGK